MVNDNILFLNFLFRLNIIFEYSNLNDFEHKVRETNEKRKRKDFNIFLIFFKLINIFFLIFLRFIDCEVIIIILFFEKKNVYEIIYLF